MKARVLNHPFIENVIQIAYDAGTLICTLPQERVDYKADNSPVTNVDLASSIFIDDHLKKITPDIPVISEESLPPHNLNAPFFWLVDPIDGTRAFMEGTPDFCVSIALMCEDKPIFGVLYGPMMQKLYYANMHGSYKRDLRGETTQLFTRNYPQDGLKILHSKSRDADDFLKKSHTFAIKEEMGLSSALKFGLIAEGLADCYPRSGPTGEWDTAAGQIILESAGGCVITKTGEPLRYNKKDYMNQSFFAWGKGPLG